ncbi:MAG: trimeric autotransporter adhesin, partial [Actinomycetota bacterium]|nr:trimeric autotransporter adhesin [Actinomycetota bacterium]
MLVAGLVAAAMALAATSLTATPNSIDFGGQDVDGSSAARETVIKNTASTPVTIESIATDNPDFAVDSQPGDCTTDPPATELLENEECTVHVVFSPQDTGTRTGTLSVASTGDDASVGLSGEGTDQALSIDPASIDFGEVEVDAGAADETAQVTNTGAGDVHMSDPSVSGDADFALAPHQVGDCDDATVLPEGESCTLRVAFDPSVRGTLIGTATVSSDEVANIDVPLTGEGIDTELGADDTDLTFDPREVDQAGASDPQTVTIENTGTKTVDFDSVDVTGDFALTGEAGDCDENTSLDPSDTCTLHVTFDPTDRGTRTGSVTVQSNAPDVVVSLTGEGIDTELTADDTDLTFDPREVDDPGASDPQTVTITNTGTQTVDFDSVDVTGDFAVTGEAGDCDGATALAPTDSCALHATFDPTDRGTRDGTVTVKSTAPDVVIDLTGEGIDTELTPDDTDLTFADREVDAPGASDPQTVTITNSGTETVDIDAIVPTGDFALAPNEAGDCDDTTSLAPNGTCALRVVFDPTDRGTRNGSVTVQSNAPDVVIDLTGKGIDTELTPDDTDLTFADREVDATGASAPQTVTITNSGTETVDIDSIVPTGDFGLAPNESGDCDDTTSLAPNGTCALRIVFDPTDRGTRTGTMTVTSNAPDVVIDLTGEGIDTELTPDRTSISFGSQDIDAGPTATEESVIENTGTEEVTFTSIALGGTNPGQFKRLTGAGNDCSTSSPLSVGATCHVRLQFDPSFKGTKSATVTLASNAPTVTIDLDGTGTRSTFQASDVPIAGGYVTNGQVNAVAFDSAGRAYLGGTFTSIGPRTGHGVKLTSTSDQPAANFPDVDGTIRAVARDGSGGWYIGGDFTHVGGLSR